MKKYVLTPTSLDESHKSSRNEAPEVPEAPMAPKRKRVFPATRREMLRDRIEDLEDELHRIFAEPNIPTFIKLKRHGDLLQAYRETYAELNKPLFAPPFSSEYLGPLPRERKPEEKQEEAFNQILSGLVAKAEQEEMEEEERTANASRIMSKIMTPQSQKHQSPFSQASFHSPLSQPRNSWPPRPIKQEDFFDDDEIIHSTPKILQKPPKPIPLKAIRQTTMAETRERRGTKPVDRLSYSRPGVQRSGHGYENKIRLRPF